MSPTTRICTGAATLAAVMCCAQVNTATAAGADELHNITYYARIDGVARGALITYKIDDTQTGSANPTMIPGRTFEANTVLADPKQAGMQVSIQWPYSANLHCEIDVDDAVVAQADQFIGPRLTPATDDPDYGTLSCGAPVGDTTGGANAPAASPNAVTGNANAVTTDPVDGSLPPDGGPPPAEATSADPAEPVGDNT